MSLMKLFKILMIVPLLFLVGCVSEKTTTEGPNISKLVQENSKNVTAQQGNATELINTIESNNTCDVFDKFTIMYAYVNDNKLYVYIYNADLDCTMYLSSSNATVKIEKYDKSTSEIIGIYKSRGNVAFEDKCVIPPAEQRQCIINLTRLKVRTNLPKYFYIVRISYKGSENSYILK